jgi:hypothetical protein
MFEKFKWAFKGFEGISGLKINFAKTKPVPLNLPVSDANAYAVFFFQCKLGKLPIKYLGLPLHWKKPSKSDWDILITKIHKRLSS